MSVTDKIHEKDVSLIVGVTTRQLRNKAEEGLFPKPVDGFYNSLPEIVQSLLKQHKKKTTPAIERLNAAKANREERKDKQEAGDTIPAPIVYSAWENIVLIFRERVLKIGNNVQSKSGLNESQRKAVDQEAGDALRELEKRLNYQAEEYEKEEDETTNKI